MKRTLSLLLTIVMVFGIIITVPVPTSAASEGDLKFTLNGDGVSYSVTDCEEYAIGSIIIPETYNGKPITGIGNSAFNYCSDLTSITIPNSVTSIGSQAFGNCTNLKSIVLPNGITFIPYIAFENCENLESVIIPESVTSIEDYAFCNCKTLESIAISGSVTHIGYGAFTCCESLTSITIPDSVTNIGITAFYGCVNLSEVTIGSGVSNIGDSAFGECTKLKEVCYNGSADKWEKITIGSGNESLLNANFNFENEDSIYNVTVYFDDTKGIVDGAGTYTSGQICCLSASNFVGYKFSKWEINDKIVSTEPTYSFKVTEDIDVTAYFISCEHTPSDWINDNSTGTKHKECTECGEILETQINTEIIDSGTCGENITWTLDEDGTLKLEGTGSMPSYYNDDSPFTGSTEIEKVVIGDGITSIGAYAFGDCDSLTTIIIGDDVEYIMNEAFAYCYNLKSIYFGNGLITVGEYAFSFCEGLTEVVLPESLQNVAECGFYGCTNLKTVTFGSKFKNVGVEAFAFCVNLTSITLPDTVVNIHENAFFGCETLKTVTLGNGIKYIGDSAFDECYKLETVLCTSNKFDFSSKEIGEYNDCLFDAVWYYNYNPSKIVTPKTTTTNEIGGIQIKWNTVPNAVKYNVYRRQGGSSSWVYVGTTTGTSLTDTKVTSGIYYVYSVRAYNSAGQYSDFVSANTQTRKYMAVPKLKGISNATNGLYITWNPIAGVTKGYRVYRRGAGSTYWTYLGTTKNTYYTDTAVKNKSGEYFRYTVIADGDYHSKFDTTGLYLKRLANPALNSAVSSKSGITVKWGAVKGTTGYYVYRKTANSSWVRIAAVGGTNNTTYLDKTAQKGVTYTYTVRAVYGATTSAYNSGISCKDKY